MSKTISADGLRSSFYDQYRHEIDAIWRNSTFLWGFEVVLFGAYGISVTKLIEADSIHAAFGYCISIVFITFIGLCISAVWIAIAKASKTWQEWFEQRIVSLEHDRDIFRFPREYAMGGTTNRLENVDLSLMSGKAGLFSPGRINIFIAQAVWGVWALFFIISLFVATGSSLELRILIFVLCGIVYGSFICIFKKHTKNEYIRKEDHGEEFILETYVRVDKCLTRLNKIAFVTPENLYDFMINDYCGLSWPLYKIYKARYDCDSFDDWLSESFENLKACFCASYIDETLSCKRFFNSIKAELERQKKYLRNSYKQS